MAAAAAEWPAAQFGKFGNTSPNVKSRQAKNPARMYLIDVFAGEFIVGFLRPAVAGLRNPIYNIVA